MTTELLTDGIDGIEQVDTDMNHFRGDATLVQLPEEVPVKDAADGSLRTAFFVVSEVTRLDNGEWECLALASTVHGTPLNYRPQTGTDGESVREVLEAVAALPGGGSE